MQQPLSRPSTLQIWKVLSGGSTDIVPEPGGKQNGTAPLQNELSDGKVTKAIFHYPNILALQALQNPKILRYGWNNSIFAEKNWSYDR